MAYAPIKRFATIPIVTKTPSGPDSIVAIIIVIKQNWFQTQKAESEGTQYRSQIADNFMKLALEFKKQTKANLLISFTNIFKNISILPKVPRLSGRI